MIFLQLFLTFLKIGAFTFGGGYAMIALIQNEVVDKHHWLTAQEFTDLIAVSQTTPGPIGINTATYAGYTAVANAGYTTTWAIIGAVEASIAVIVIPIVLMLIVCRFLSRYKSHPLTVFLLSLLRLTVVGLIASAALGLLTVENFGSWSDNPSQLLLSVTLFAAAFAATVVKVPQKSPWLQRLTSPITLLIVGGLISFLVIGH